MDKGYILEEIRRTAATRGNRPLGRRSFEIETGIRPHDWYGVYLARWGDALRDAGFEPNDFQDKIPDELLLEHIVSLTLRLGHLPTHGEMRLEERCNPNFPSHSTFARLGSKTKLASRVLAHCQSRSG